MSPTVDAEANETLDAAQDAGAVGSDRAVEIVGTIGDGAGLATDVDWFRFTLEQPGSMQFSMLPNADGSNSLVVLTLYGDQIAGYDPTLPLGHQLLGRSEGRSDGEAASIDGTFQAGTYFVAVSGAGNRFFHPFLADSGTPGIGGEYGLRVTQFTGFVGPVGLNVDLGPTGGFTSAVRPETIVGDDTPATAIDLGNLTNATRLQALGTIGDDPFYSFESEDPFAMNPAADVDLFHFEISGDGEFALVAEAFAGRIGSTLDPALTLFRDNAGVLEQIATNNNTLNPVETTNGYIPLFSDPVLFAGLTAGDYFLAVSSAGNDAESGPDGLFDPQVAHSGLNGYSVGAYVLDLLVTADSEAPQVLGYAFNVPGLNEVEVRYGRVADLPQAPTHFSLRFSEPVNVQQLAHTAFMQVNSSTIRSVFIQDANGQRYFPRLESYDSITGIARFLMLDGLPNGELELHVSGAEGLTDLAGHPIVGNDASGDRVLRFNVSGPDRGSADDVTTWLNQPANDSADQPQDLGVLFPHEIQAGVHLVREALATASDSDDFYRFEVLQNQNYFFTLTNLGDGSAPTMELLDANGQVIPLNVQGNGTVLFGPLDRGVYILHVGPWSAAAAGDVAYAIEIELGGVSENPTPLTNGAAPAVGIRLGGHGPVAISTPIQATTVSPIGTGTTPSGLNDNLAALPLGLPSNSALAATSTANDNRIVRLFGFGDRDRLFSMIDSILSRPVAEPLSVTKAELSDSELADILKLNGNASDNIEADGSDETPTSDAVTNEESSDGTVEANGETGSSVTDEATGKSTVPQPLTQRAAGSRRPARRPQPKAKPVDEQPTNAAVSPLAIALAASLASTLRERARREMELPQEFVGV